MIAYLILVLLPGFFALSVPRESHNRLLLPMVFAIYVIFGGLRWRVGMDWNNYDIIHHRMLLTDVWDAVARSEPLSFALFWLSSNLDMGMQLTNIVAAASLALGIFAFAVRTPHVWLGILSATPYLFIAFGLSAVRQAIAIGIVLIVFSRWHRPTSTRLAGIALASLFHTSALCAILLVLADMRLSPIPKILASLVLLAFVGYLLQTSDTFSGSVEGYTTSYFGQQESIVSPGALLHMSLVQVPAIAHILFRRHLEPFVAYPSLIRIGCWSAIGLVALFLFSSTAASRIVLYLYFVPIAVYPAIAQAIVARHRFAAIVGILVLQVGVLVAWLNFANNSSAHIPYRNILTEQVF